MIEKFECVFCGGKTKPIIHDKGNHLVISKCEECGIVLFFCFNREMGWRFKNYEKPREPKGE